MLVPLARLIWIAGLVFLAGALVAMWPSLAEQRPRRALSRAARARTGMTAVAVGLAALLAVACVVVVALPFLREPRPSTIGSARRTSSSAAGWSWRSAIVSSPTSRARVRSPDRKVSDEDYRALVGPLRSRAASALRALEPRAEAEHAKIGRDVEPIPAPAPTPEPSPSPDMPQPPTLTRNRRSRFRRLTRANQGQPDDSLDSAAFQAGRSPGPPPKSTPMARLIGLSLVLLVVLAAPAAGTQRAHAVSNDERIRILQEKIAQAQAQEGLASEIASVETKIRDLESQVGGVTRLADLEHDLALHREKLERITRLFNLQTERLNFLRAQYELAVVRLSKRSSRSTRTTT